MPVKKQPDNSVVFLVVDKEELKAKIEERIQLGSNIAEQQISSNEEKNKIWAEFIDWNNFNEELIRQAFDKPINIYLEEYKYKADFSIDALYGKNNTFQEDVEEDKSAIKFQIKKIRWFFEKVELLKSPENVSKSDTSRNSFNSLQLVLKRFHKVAQTIRERHNNLETIIIKNEYDVQDLLHGLLQIYFDDIRKEDSSPSHAGANSRLDFVLKTEKVIIEAKND